MPDGGSRVPRVLVVEDDPHLLKSLRDILGDEGYDVQIAQNGSAAIRQLATRSPDVILLDLNMPIMSGDDVLEWLKQRGGRIPVVIATQDDDVQAADLGVVAKLSKPYEVEQLLEVLAFALREGP